MAKEVKFKITAVNATKAAFQAVKNGFKSIKIGGLQTAAILATGFNQAMQVVRSAIGLLIKPVQVLGRAIGEAFKKEKYMVQLDTLLGGIDEAKKRLKDLTEFSASTPFELDSLVEANRIVETFTEGTFDAIEILTKLGDAAAQNGKPIEELADAFGKFVSRVRGGKKVGEELIEPLQTLGVLTGTASRELKKLAGEEAIGFLIKQLEKSAGGMEKLSKTGVGLVSTLKDNVKLNLAVVGQEFLELSKGAISNLISRLKALREDGSLQAFAQRASEIASRVADVVGDLFSTDSATRNRAIEQISSSMVDIGNKFTEVIAKGLVSVSPAIGAGIATGFVAAAKGGVKSFFGFGSDGFDGKQLVSNLSPTNMMDPLNMNQAWLDELKNIGRNTKETKDVIKEGTQ